MALRGRRYLCWDSCAADFAWRENRVFGMRVSRSPLSCLFRVHSAGRMDRCALHRFFEVSAGILVALAVVAVWLEHQPRIRKNKRCNDLRVVLEDALCSRTNSRSRFVSAGSELRADHGQSPPGCETVETIALCGAVSPELKVTPRTDAADG